MARNLRPRGSVVRTPQDFFARNLVGAQATNGPCVGNHTGIGIYNNASDGSVIRVYFIQYEVSPATLIYFKLIQGAVGGLQGGIGTPGAIDPRTPAQAGQIYAWATAAGQGVAAGGVSAEANIVYTKATGWPLGVIPPGYTWGLETNTTNVTLIAWFEFLTLYD